MHPGDRLASQFEFIDLVLSYEGVLTNQRLREQFGIANVQASRVLSAYRDANPHNLVRLEGNGRGRYGPGMKFRPSSDGQTINRYFEVVEDPGTPIESVRFDFTQIDPLKFRAIHQAVTSAGCVRVVYRSMNHPNGRERTLHPHAFVWAGRRWHVRAFDEATSEHRDFNLSRIAEVEPFATTASPPPDAEWEQHVQLLLVPHPALSADQQRLIRDELFGGAAGRYVLTRRALMQYVLNDLEVAEDPESQMPPRHQIYLQRVEGAP